MNPKKHLAIVVPALALSVAAPAYSAVLLTENFETRDVGTQINYSSTSGGVWNWHNVPDSLQIGYSEGKSQFGNLSGIATQSASFRDSTGNWLTLPAANTNQLSFDLYWLNNVGGGESDPGHGMTVYFGVTDRWANLTATSSNHAEGYQLTINPVGVNSVDVWLRQRTTAFVNVIDPVRVTIPGAIITAANGNTDHTIPGATISVDLTWTATDILLTVNGTTVLDTTVTNITRTPANEVIEGDADGNTYIQFWSGALRAKGIDNIVISSTSPIPEPSSFALAMGGVAMLGGALRRRRA